MMELLQSVNWTQVLIALISAAGTAYAAYLTATKQWTAQGRAERKERKQKEQEQAEFDKQQDDLMK